MVRMEIVEPSGTIAYWCSESFEPTKETLFFLHGLTADHTMFQSQFDYFKREFNIITWDAPAHGESRPFDDFTYEKAANAMKDIIDVCNISRVILIGQSMGGFIAQSFIARYGEMVKGFVAIDSTPYGDYYSKSDIWWLKQIEWMAKLFPKSMLKWAMAKQVAVTKIGQDNMRSMLSVYEKEELCHLMGIGYAGFLEDNRELNISCPVLLIVGEKDNTGKVKTYNREWSKNTGFSLVWIKNAAHNSNVDAPELVNIAIKEFLHNIKIA